MAQDFALSFYKSKAWKSTRALYIQSVNGLCENCLARGIYTPGKVVHHIIHLTPENINNPAIALDFHNLKLVCQDCHAMEHKGEVNRRYDFDKFGNIVVRE